jgi:hypothetical protein
MAARTAAFQLLIGQLLRQKFLQDFQLGAFEISAVFATGFRVLVDSITALFRFALDNTLHLGIAARPGVAATRVNFGAFDGRAQTRHRVTTLRVAAAHRGFPVVCNAFLQSAHDDWRFSSIPLLATPLEDYRTRSL